MPESRSLTGIYLVEKALEVIRANIKLFSVQIPLHSCEITTAVFLSCESRSQLINTNTKKSNNSTRKYIPSELSSSSCKEAPTSITRKATAIRKVFLAMVNPDTVSYQLGILIAASFMLMLLLCDFRQLLNHRKTKSHVSYFLNVPRNGILLFFRFTCCGKKILAQ